MKVRLSRTTILDRAEKLVLRDPRFRQVIERARTDKYALEALRVEVLTDNETSQEFATYPDEDGPCAGWGGNTALIS